LSITVKIPLSELQPGMIVVKFDKGGITYPYYGRPFPDKKLCQYLERNGIEYAFIRQDNAPSMGDMHEENKVDPRTYVKSVSEGISTESSEKLPTIGEIQAAVSLHSKAKEVTTQLLMDARLGKMVDSGAVKTIVSELVEQCIASPEAFVNVSRLKDYDQYTFTHSVNVSVLSIAIGRRLGTSLQELNNLGFAGLLHDVGKMKVPEGILNKPGKLTDAEFEIMKSHPALGYDYLRNERGISQEILYAVKYHHEKADGSGYPSGLTDKEIPRFAKIIAIADVYDAITSERVYHKGMVPSDALKLIFSWSGKHFNESLVKFFINIMGIYPVGTLVLLDTNELAIILEPNKDDPMRPKILLVSNTNMEPATPHFFDLTKRNVASGAPYKTIISSLDPRDFSIDTNRLIEQYIKG
jgi:putative nucleotidyltransferase with HDIG domain